MGDPTIFLQNIIRLSFSRLSLGVDEQWRPASVVVPVAQDVRDMRCVDREERAKIGREKRYIFLLLTLVRFHEVADTLVALSAI
jgi:hypothetical protein